MHSLIIFALAPLALANDLSKRVYLHPRQGSDAFIPGTTPTFNCQNPCGDLYCLIPSRGDTCCVEGYACPGGSFCLTKGYCCPDGEDPATCARQNGVALPDGFKAGQTIAAGGPSSAAAPVIASSSPIVAPSPPTTPVAPTPASVTPASVTPVAISSATAPFLIPLSNTTLPPPSTGTGTSTPTTSPVPFTGGAIRHAMDGVIAAIIFVATALLM